MAMKSSYTTRWDTIGAWLRHELPGFLTRDNDKALFDDLIGQGLTDKGEGGESAEGYP